MDAGNGPTVVGPIVLIEVLGAAVVLQPEEEVVLRAVLNEAVYLWVVLREAVCPRVVLRDAVVVEAPEMGYAVVVEVAARLRRMDLSHVHHARPLIALCTAT